MVRPAHGDHGFSALRLVALGHLLGVNAFHPGQAQFLGFLTVVRAFPLLSLERTRPRDYYIAALCFVFAYLSWEGIGFLLPVIFLTGLIVNWGRWAWLRQRHLWISVAGVFVVVVAQGIRRVLLQVDYLMVGSGKSEVSMPQLVFTHVDYQPWFYLNNFFAMESHLALSAVFALGLLVLGRSWNLRFVYAVVLGAVFFLTNFLPFSSAHYLYWILPMFLIGVSAATFALADAMFERAQGLRTSRAAVAVMLALVLLFELAGTSSAGFRFYDASAWEDMDRPDIRQGLAEADYRGLAEAMNKQHRPGDVIVTLAALPMDLYGGTKGDYFLQSITGQKVVYDPGAEAPRYVDKYAGNPVLRSRAELEDLLYHHHRVWLLIAPYSVFTKIQDADLIDFVRTRMDAVAETNDGYLYLWDH